MAQQPQWSADGQWWWDGHTWIPATQAHGHAAPGPIAPISPARTPRRESSVWLGVVALLIMIVQAPLAIIFTFGLIGFAILWAVTGSLGNAILFDLYFALWSVVAMLPIVLAYCIGGLFRLIAWSQPTDSFAGITAMVAGFGCFLIGVDMFLSGWSRFDRLTYWLGWVVIALFGVTYLGGSPLDGLEPCGNWTNEHATTPVTRRQVFLGWSTMGAREIRACYGLSSE